MDLSKLPPAPWAWKDYELSDGADDYILHGCYDGEVGGDACTKEFIALARNAFDVMMRRGWFPVPILGGGWSADFIDHNGHLYLPIRADDPFTALVEADRWYRENVEQEKAVKERAVPDHR